MVPRKLFWAQDWGLGTDERAYDFSVEKVLFESLFSGSVVVNWAIEGSGGDLSIKSERTLLLSDADSQESSLFLREALVEVAEKEGFSTASLVAVVPVPGPGILSSEQAVF